MPIDCAEALTRVPLFAPLEPAERERLADEMHELEFEAGSTIIRQGERGARVLAFFVVVDGEAAVVRDGDVVARLGPGDFFGEIGLFRDVPRTATVRAETDVRCFAFSAWDFRRCVQGHPQIAWQLLETLAERVAANEEVANRSG